MADRKGGFFSFQRPFDSGTPRDPGHWRAAPEPFFHFKNMILFTLGLYLDTSFGEVPDPAGKR